LLLSSLIYFVLTARVYYLLQFRIDVSRLNGPFEQLGAGARPRLAVYFLERLGDVILGRAPRLRNFRIGVPLAQQFQNLPFGWRQVHVRLLDGSFAIFVQQPFDGGHFLLQIHQRRIVGGHFLAPRNQIVNCRQQLVRIKWFGQVHVGARLVPLDAILRQALGGEEHHGNPLQPRVVVVLTATNPLQQLQSRRTARHANVGNDARGDAAARWHLATDLDGGLCVGARGQLVAGIVEKITNGLSDRFFVVDKEDPVLIALQEFGVVANAFR